MRICSEHELALCELGAQGIIALPSLALDPLAKKLLGNGLCSGRGAMLRPPALGELMGGCVNGSWAIGIERVRN